MSGIMGCGLWKWSKSFPHNFHRFSTVFPQSKIDAEVFILRLLTNRMKFSTFPWPLDFYFYIMITDISLTFFIFCLDKGVHFSLKIVLM